MPMDNCFPSHMRLSALKMMTTGYGSFVFFVKSLKPMLPCFSLLEIKMSLVFLFDRQKSLLEGVECVFPNSPHRFCMKPLEENFHKQFTNTALKKLLWKPA